MSPTYEQQKEKERRALFRLVNRTWLTRMNEKCRDCARRDCECDDMDCQFDDCNGEMDVHCAKCDDSLCSTHARECSVCHLVTCETTENPGGSAGSDDAWSGGCVACDCETPSQV